MAIIWLALHRLGSDPDSTLPAAGYTCYQSALPSSFWYGACVPDSVPLMQVVNK